MAKVIKVGKGATQYKVVIAKNALTKVNLLRPLKTKGKVLIITDSGTVSYTHLTLPTTD